MSDEKITWRILADNFWTDKASRKALKIKLKEL